MKSEFMAGKRGLIMGLANNKSIAWGIAKACADAGAELAFSYQGDQLKKRVDPLAAEHGVDMIRQTGFLCQRDQQRQGRLVQCRLGIVEEKVITVGRESIEPVRVIEQRKQRRIGGFGSVSGQLCPDITHSNRFLASGLIRV